MKEKRNACSAGAHCTEEKESLVSSSKWSASGGRALTYMLGEAILMDPATVLKLCSVFKHVNLTSVSDRHARLS